MAEYEISVQIKRVLSGNGLKVSGRMITGVDLSRPGGWCLDGRFMGAQTGRVSELVRGTVRGENNGSPAFYLSFQLVNSPTRKVHLFICDPGKQQDTCHLETPDGGIVEVETRHLGYLGSYTEGVVDHRTSRAATSLGMAGKVQPQFISNALYQAGMELLRLGLVPEVNITRPVPPQPGQATQPASGNLTSIAMHLSASGGAGAIAAAMAAVDTPPAPSVYPDWARSVMEAADKGNKIEAIKRYRQATSLGLVEAKDAVDGYLKTGTLALPTPPGPILRESDIPRIDGDQTSCQLDPDVEDALPELPGNYQYANLVSGVIFVKRGHKNGTNEMLFVDALIDRMDDLDAKQAAALEKMLVEQQKRLEALAMVVGVVAQVAGARKNISQKDGA